MNPGRLGHAWIAKLVTGTVISTSPVTTYCTFLLCVRRILFRSMREGQTCDRRRERGITGILPPLKAKVEHKIFTETNRRHRLKLAPSGAIKPTRSLEN